MSDVVYKSWSREQLLEQAMEFMRCGHPQFPPGDTTARDRWLERQGLLVIFAAYLWDTQAADTEVKG